MARKNTRSKPNAGVSRAGSSSKRATSKVREKPNRAVSDKLPTMTTGLMSGFLFSALTLDAFSNPLSRLGAGTTDATQFTQYIKQNLTAQYSTLTALYRENWVVKRLIDVVPEDMTKSWYRIKSQLPPDSKQRIARLERRTRIRERILEGLKWGRLYGGAVAVIVIDGHDDILDQPLAMDMIMPGSFKGLIVVDRWSGVTPSHEIVENIDDPEFGLPEYYSISTPSFGFGIRVHHSRILRFTGRPLPYIEELAETYWGTSELEHVYSEIVKYDNTSYNIAALVFKANLSVYKMDGFDQLATAPDSVKRNLYNTLTMMNWMMNSQGMQIMGKDDGFETQQYTFAGLSDIYEMFMLDVSGASEIPVTKLFGRSPAGMNATGESDMQNYYDSIEEKQEAYLKPIIDRLLPILCMSEFSAIPDDLDFEFEPVRRPSEDEKKTLSTQVTTAISTMFNAGIISQKIALKELRESARATGMWNNITDEDIERADDSFGLGGEPPTGDDDVFGTKFQKDLASDGYYDIIKSRLSSDDDSLNYAECTDADGECRAKDPSKCRVHGNGGNSGNSNGKNKKENPVNKSEVKGKLTGKQKIIAEAEKKAKTEPPNYFELSGRSSSFPPRWKAEKFSHGSTSKDHYSRHGEALGAKDEADYVEKAKEFLHSPLGETGEAFVGNDNRIYKYDYKTKIFAIATSKGEIHTYWDLGADKGSKGADADWEKHKKRSKED